MKVLVKDGATLTITPTVTPSTATVTWTSDDETVATVNNGVVTPKALGIAKITAKSGDLTATCEVFVGTEVDLSSETADYNTNDYDILSGDIGAHYINILNSHHVAFNGMATTKGISCMGDATIYLIDGKTNTLTAPNNSPGIWIGGTGKTFTINAETEGTGILNATGGNNAAGIGTGNASSGNIENGNITINGGTVTAKGGAGAAGIGTGYAYDNNNTCGTITITGGTVTAEGGKFGAGIGTGYATAEYGSASNQCGNITIDATVTKVTAKKNSSIPGPNSIGVGQKYGGGNQDCGTITIGGDATTYAAGVTTSPFTYTPAP